MRKTILLGTILILLQIPLLAYVLLQQRTWGGERRDGANGVAVGSDGSVYVTGETRSFGDGDGDAFLLRYNSRGRLQWQRTYGTRPDPENSGEEAGIDIAMAPDGSGVVVLGNYRDGNIFLAKFDPEGNLIWDRTWGSTQEGAGAIAIANDGTIYVTGITFGFDVEQGDAFLLSFSPAGSLNWQRTWGGAFFDVGRGVAVASDGAVFVTGETLFTANAAFLVKFAPGGSVIWEREWGVVGVGGFPEDDDTDGNAVAAAPAGGAYVVGATTGTGQLRNLVIAHVDAAGSFVWQRVGGPGFGAAEDVAVGPEGRIHVTGTVLSDDETTAGNAFIWTLRETGNGNDAALWGGGGEFEAESGRSIAAAPDGTIVVAGIAGAPPYTLSPARRTSRKANTFINPVTGTVTTPAGVVNDPAAEVTEPRGRQSFAGETDAFLIRVQR
jgi:hypothetical protein